MLCILGVRFSEKNSCPDVSGYLCMACQMATEWTGWYWGRSIGSAQAPHLTCIIAVWSVDTNDVLDFSHLLQSPHILRSTNHTNLKCFQLTRKLWEFFSSKFYLRNKTSMFWHFWRFYQTQIRLVIYLIMAASAAASSYEDESFAICANNMTDIMF